MLNDNESKMLDHQNTGTNGSVFIFEIRMRIVSKIKQSHIHNLQNRFEHRTIIRTWCGLDHN